MKRICCYCDCWESGGIESFLCNVLLHMDIKNLEFDLVASQIKESVFTQRLETHGIRFFELSGSQRNIAKNHALFRELLRERQYDAVHLNIFQGMSLYYGHLAKEAGVPVRIAHSHNTNLRQSRTRKIKLWLHRKYSKRYAKDATDFWACSKAAAKFMFPQQLLDKRGFTFVPNGIDTERFHFGPAGREAVRQELGVADRFVIGNVGRLCYQKNQTFLLDVLVETLKQRPDCCLLLVGDGEDCKTLEEKAKSLGVADHVIFFGTTDRVEELFWAMDVFVMPSRFEGLPVTSVEAQAAGLPCVFSDSITRECDLTDAVFVALDAGCASWADAIVKQRPRDRSLAAETVRCAGFDTEAVAQRVQTYYLRQDKP